MKKNTSWEFMDESSVTFRSSISGPGEFGHYQITIVIIKIIDSKIVIWIISKNS